MICKRLWKRDRRISTSLLLDLINLLIRDGGGCCDRAGQVVCTIEFDGELITAGAAALDVQVARSAQQAGVAGLEFLAGIPGSIGGAVRMNAGAYGSEIGDVITNATVLDEKAAPMF